MKFTKKEVRDLLFSWILLSVAFAILFVGGYDGLILRGSLLTKTFIFALVGSFLTAGIGFILHELAHKHIAQNYGLITEFRAFYKMLWLSIGFSLAGFIIAAPGAVMIKGHLTREKNGKISLAGPLTNFILGIMFFVGLFFVSSGFLGLIFSYGFKINALLAVFNMVPFGAFDGAKIIYWSRRIYWTFTVLFFILFLFSFMI